ncbi:MAG: hypothetical protein U0984_03635 [Prosthecobacter sp.]|nr:hypothetical protein [Prosthecobacter sp.]
MKKMLIRSALLALLLAIGFSIVRLIARERDSWTEVVPGEGGAAEIEYHYSQRRYFGHPHVIGFGGGDEKFDLRIKHGGKTYRWQGAAIPVVLRHHGDQLFMVGFDRESSPKGCVFRLYRSDADRNFTEIDRAEFPKDLAIQNLWLDSNGEQALNPMDASNRHFCSSLTARLWQYLELGIQYWEEKPAKPDFLIRYRDSYLKSVVFGTTKMPGAVVGGSSPEFRRVH